MLMAANQLAPQVEPASSAHVQCTCPNWKKVDPQTPNKHTLTSRAGLTSPGFNAHRRRSADSSRTNRRRQALRAAKCEGGAPRPPRAHPALVHAPAASEISSAAHVTRARAERPRGVVTFLSIARGLVPAKLEPATLMPAEMRAPRPT